VLFISRSSSFWEKAMFRTPRLLAALAVSVAISSSDQSLADMFGSGNLAFEIDFVTIGDPGNVADTTGDPNPAGSVPYTYRIGKYEISEQMVEKANELGGLELPLIGRGPDRPATLSWFNATKFVNWLNESQGHHPAYNFDDQGIFDVWHPEDAGYNPSNRYRNTRAAYFLPDVHEWYKAAYFDAATDDYYLYATGSDDPPVSVASGTLPNTAVIRPVPSEPADIMNAGGLSPYGTMAQGGNIYEWNETDPGLVNNGGLARIFRGGTWSSGAGRSNVRRGAWVEYGGYIGFRVASIPEPSSTWLAIFGLVAAGRFARVGHGRELVATWQ
jgi:sulfatase modifying factor 1